MTIYSRENSPLYEFLDTARVRLEFWNTVSAAAMAASVASALAFPVVIFRAKLELRDGLLVFAVLTTAAVLFAALAMRRSVRLAQVIERLEIAPEDRDRIASGAEFLGDDDPLKRLAVQETEEWISGDRERLSKIKMRRSPFVAAVAILLLILLWLLTPGFHQSSIHEQIALTTNASHSVQSSPMGNANSQIGSDRPHAAGLTAALSATSNVGSLPSFDPARPASVGGGNLPSNMPGHSSTAAPNLKPTPSGKVPVHRPHEESHASLPGGAGHSTGGIPFTKVPTPILSQGATVPVHAANARPTDSAKEREAEGNPTDIPPRAHAAPIDVRFANPEIDPAELESLPPGRRQLVIEYFRAMHNEATAAPTTQP